MVLVDFGSETSFVSAVQKVKRHYGVDVASSTTRLDVEKHAENMQKVDYALAGKNRAEASVIISGIDGSMVPIVSQKPTETPPKDKRKNKQHEWKEVRLSLAKPKGSTKPIYAATIGTTTEAGKQLAAVVNKAGRGKDTKIHCLGDGALWIAEQVEIQFGADASFLLDFFHVSDYLAEAAPCCAPDSHQAWLKKQQTNLKEGRITELITELQTHICSACALENACPAAKCYNYLLKRLKQLDYKAALAAELPIGSGEIEGAHRSVIQVRLKISGAWWTRDNANNMVHLRTVIANDLLDAYWAELRSSRPPRPG
jgi:hypothetical protein